MKKKGEMTRPLRGVGSSVALILVLVMAKGVQAQATTLAACYVPRSGVVYRVNAPESPGENADLKDGCAGGKHVPFQWNEEGPEGAIGPKGPAGPDGAAGQDGFSGWEVVQQTFIQTTGGTTLCPVGKVVLSGGFLAPDGYRSGGFLPRANVSLNAPVRISENQWGWTVGGTSLPLGNWTIYAVCANAS